jgi:hypothetical protein
MKIIKYLFLIIGIISLFFINYSNLTFDKNQMQYLIIGGSLIGYLILNFSEKVKMTNKIRILLAKIILMISGISFIGSFLLYFNQMIPLALLVTSLFVAISVASSMFLTLKKFKISEGL